MANFVYDVSGACIQCFTNLNILVGGNEPRLVDAATKQLNTLPFYHSFWNRTTKPSLVWQKLRSIFYMKKENLVIASIWFLRFSWISG